MIEKQFINTTEAAKVLGLSAYTIREMVKDGRLTAYRPTRYILFDRDELIATIKSCKM